MRIIRLLIVTLIFLFPFGQLLRIPLFESPAVRIYANDVVIIIITIAWLAYLVTHRQRFKIPPAFNAVVLFAAAALVSIVLNSFRYELNELLIGSLYLWRWMAYSFVYLAVYHIIRENKNEANHFSMLLTIAGVAAAVLGLAQYATYPDLRNLMYLGWDPHQHRIFGTFLDSGFAGLIYVLTLILITVRLIGNGKSAGGKISDQFKRGVNNSIRAHMVWSICWIITYFALALTYSRSSFLSLLVAFGIISLLKKTALPFLFVGILLAGTVVLLPRPSETAEGTKLERTASVGARLTNYQQSMEIIQDAPLFGIGFNMMRYENRDRGFVQPYEWRESNAAAGLDNSFLFITATTGIIGLAAYIFLLLKIITASMNYYVQGKPGQGELSLLASLAAVIAHSFFNNSLFYPWIMLWLWLLLGIGDGARDRLGVAGAVARDYFDRLLTIAQSVFMRK